MERINRILSVLLMALIGCVTVFQCHHHDADGHAFFLTYGNEEVTSGLRHGDCHSHDCESAGDDDEHGCGMHLTDATNIENAGHDFDGAANTAICQAADFFFELSAPPAGTADIFYDKDRTGTPAAGYSRTTLLRGPPSV